MTMWNHKTIINLLINQTASWLVLASFLPTKHKNREDVYFFFFLSLFCGIGESSKDLNQIADGSIQV